VTATTASFGWHIDDNPQQLMKIFLYLNDVEENNGAFRALPLHDSRKLLRAGFISNSIETRQKNQSLVQKYLQKNPDSLTISELSELKEAKIA
jgi:hypothetical protein